MEPKPGEGHRVPGESPKKGSEISVWFQEQTVQLEVEFTGLTTLERRRVRGDLIETYKILTNREKINNGDFFQLADQQHGPRGHTR